MSMDIESVITRVKEKSIAPRKYGESMYCKMSEYESTVIDYFWNWRHPELDPKHVAEDFYTRVIPLATKNGDLKRELDTSVLYRDQSRISEKYFIGQIRSVFASYTSIGVRRIDSYFYYRIRYMSSFEEGMEIENQIILCPHLHIKIKENLIDNLKSSMNRFPK